MNNSPKPYETLNEGKIKDALIESRGDLFIAAQLLGITAIRLDRAVSVSPTLQVAISTLRSEMGAHHKPAELAAMIDRRAQLYRVVGLDALHDLATMPVDVNSAQNQVKLAAAARLAGETGVGGSGGDLAETLRALNDDYLQQAPRLRIVRQTLTVEVNGPASEPATIESVPERLLPSE